MVSLGCAVLHLGHFSGIQRGGRLSFLSPFALPIGEANFLFDRRASVRTVARCDLRHISLVLLLLPAGAT